MDEGHEETNARPDVQHDRNGANMGGGRDALHAQNDGYVETDEVRETKIAAQLSCIAPNSMDAHRTSLT